MPEAGNLITIIANNISMIFESVRLESFNLLPLSCYVEL